VGGEDQDQTRVGPARQTNNGIPMTKMRSSGWLALAILAMSGIGLAQIKKYTLGEMVAEMDNAVFGEIVDRHVFRVDHPIDGPELYFTTITIEGRSLADGSPMTVDVTYHGGFVSADEGVHNSEAPAEDDVRLGNQVVVFYSWSNNMGGDVAGNAMMAAHGGLYRALQGPNSATVLGRGAGYALARNVKLANLDAEVTRIFEDVQRRKR
jgi:hypothetical protein